MIIGKSSWSSLYATCTQGRIQGGSKLIHLVDGGECNHIDIERHVVQCIVFFPSFLIPSTEQIVTMYFIIVNSENY